MINKGIDRLHEYYWRVLDWYLGIYKLESVVFVNTIVLIMLLSLLLAYRYHFCMFYMWKGDFKIILCTSM